MSELDLNALIGSRICHDLISPLGAIGNGVELLGMSGHAVGPEMALISESVENANARIRFFRVAFGSASAEAMIGQSEIVSILGGMYRTGRLRVRWEAMGDQPRRLVKLAFLTLQCVESALVWGGEVTIREVGGRFVLDGTGERVKQDAALWALALGQGQTPELAASDVHFALVPLAAERAGRQLTADISETRVTVSF